MRIVLCHAMCHRTCNDVMHTLCGDACRQASHSYNYMVCQKLLIAIPFVSANQYLSKLTASHINTLTMQIANQNMLKRILIAIQNENKANCNENFGICAEES